MKRFYFILAWLLITTAGLFAQNGAKITFPETTHDFESIAENKGSVSCKFTFKNTGDQPLIIIRAAASCGCTTPEYPKNPIAPGKTGDIKVSYNPKGRPGAFQKNITVYTNADPDKSILSIKGTVISSDKK